MFKLVRTVAALLTACVSGAIVSPARAAENGVLAYPPGSPGPFVNMFPPIPGVFLLNQNFITPSGRLHGPDGRQSRLPVKVGTQGSAQRIVVSYPEPVLGARFYQQLVLPIVNVDLNAFGQRNGEFGLGNIIFSPFILRWTLAQHQYLATGLDVALPLGSYDRNQALNVANNYTSFQPVLSYRYYDPEGFTVGVATRLLLNTMNDVTRYTSGTTVVADFDVGYSIGKWRLGAVGGYAQQIEDDRQFGRSVPPGGDRYRTLSVGPSITYNFDPIILNVNYQFGVIAENTIKSDTLWVNLAVPLYVGGPPPSATRTLVRK